MIWDAVVVGAGPAGLSAGFYLSRAGFRTLCLEKERAGGQASHLPRISNYPGFPKGVGGAALMKRFLEQALKYGLKTRKASVRRVEAGRTQTMLLTDRGTVRSRAVILATGSRFLPLGLPGESRFYGRGLHHAVFDRARRFSGRVVGVIGGGETAAHPALALARHAR
ncbi:MAG: NAD(P)/FAD-dependent oxidoreductase, partial [Elusimicrobiota bacterium]